MDQLKKFFKEHKKQSISVLILLPLVILGVFLVLQQTVLKPKAGGGNTHALKIGLAAGSKSEIAPNETTKVVVSADMGSENILGFDIVLNYDSQMFETPDLKPGQIFDSVVGGKGIVTVKSFSNGEIKLSWAAFNQSSKQFITNMSSSYGASPTNVELFNVILKAKPNASGSSSVSFGDNSKNQLVTVEGSGNKAIISAQRAVDLTVSTNTPGSATLSLSPVSGSFKKGCDFSTQVVVNTSGKTADGVDAVLTYDPNKLTVTSITNGTIFGTYPVKTANPQTRKITISGVATVDQGFQGTGNFATINFKVNDSASAGSTTVTFDYTQGSTIDSNIVEKDTTEDILGSVTNSTFTVEDGTCGTASDPSKPVVTAACVGGSPAFNMSWTGTVGRGADGDTANRGKNGFYVDISTTSGFDLVYNKFIETTQTTVGTNAPAGFVLANAGSTNPPTGSPLNLASGTGYFVRVYNGTHSPTSDRIVAPSC